MPTPTMLAVDDHPEVLASISRDPRSRYGREYRIVGASSGDEALDVLKDLALRAGPVALVPSGLRRIIVGRHRGDISIGLPPGEIVLRVWLPRQHVEPQ